jgi:UDPglucose--hexose-1-phosphate uridylyltransferase
MNRYLALQDVPGIETVMIFKNHGPMAGCSLEHPHSQIVAVPIIPPNVRARTALAADYFKRTGCCVYCKMIEEELTAKTRVLIDSDKFVSFLPFAGAMPFTIWIVPRRHLPSFARIDSADIKDLARVLKDAVRRLYFGLANPDYNLTIRSYPVGSEEDKFCHWYLSIIPRLSEPGGFEMGTMMVINASLPEDGARFLRSITCQA